MKDFIEFLHTLPEEPKVPEGAVIEDEEDDDEEFEDDDDDEESEEDDTEVV